MMAPVNVGKCYPTRHLLSLASRSHERDARASRCGRGDRVGIRWIGWFPRRRVPMRHPMLRPQSMRRAPGAAAGELEHLLMIERLDSPDWLDASRPPLSFRQPAAQVWPRVPAFWPIPAAARRKLASWRSVRLVGRSLGGSIRCKRRNRRSTTAGLLDSPWTPVLAFRALFEKLRSFKV